MSIIMCFCRENKSDPNCLVESDDICLIPARAQRGKQFQSQTFLPPENRSGEEKDEESSQNPGENVQPNCPLQSGLCAQPGAAENYEDVSDFLFPKYFQVYL